MMRNRAGGLAAVACALALALAPALGGASSASGQGVDETCLLALTKVDEGTTNVLYPDDSARYYSGAFAAVPGTEILIAGRFPHARYMSFNVYDPALRPLDSLADVQLAPDPGSINPFAIGANRNAANRSYTAHISFAPAPATRQANTMYAGTGEGGAPNPVGVFTYRIYIPDTGQDEYGGVGLPTAEVVTAGTDQPVSPSVCAQVQRPEQTELNTLLEQANSAPAAEPQAAASGRNPPHWRKFVNVLSSVGEAVTDNPSLNNAGQSELDTLGGSGGFLSNRDNAYVSAFVNRGFGQVVVTRFRAPTFPNTRPGTPIMPGGQLRYWSLCQNDPITERVVSCTNDDRAVIGANGMVTFVVSTPNERPANATANCGVNWIPWGPDARGVLIYRNMLPSPSFAQSIQKATVDHEPQTMGDYFPVSRYYSDAAAYQALGCRTAGGSPAAAVAPAGAHPAPACHSHRSLVLHVPDSTRAVTLGHRRLRVRHGQVLVDLRGRGPGVARVLVHLRDGRTLVRAFHTCEPARAARSQRRGR